MSSAALDPTSASAPTAEVTELVESSDIDEAQSIGGRIYYPHTTRALGRSPFRLNIDVARLGAVTLGWLNYGTEVQVKTGPLSTAYHVNVPVGGQLRTASGDERVLATARNAAVYRIDRSSLFWGWSEPCCMLAIKIDRSAVERELGSMLGRRIEGPVDFSAALDLGQGRGAQWWTLVDALSKQIRDPASLMMHPLLGESLARNVVAGLLLASDHSYRGELDKSDERSCASAVRRAVDYIEQHATEPLTVGDIASAAGVGVRALQQNFRSAFDTTPLNYLRNVRLSRARSDLLDADPHLVGVSEVAYRWGFAHLGRFAQQYREMYGETPSDSLRRSV